jgi:hypothetical protein
LIGNSSAVVCTGRALEHIERGCVGIVYDKDSSDFKDEYEEAEYDGLLDGLETDGGLVRAWQIDRKHEDAVRRAGQPDDLL